MKKFKVFLTNLNILFSFSKKSYHKTKCDNYYLRTHYAKSHPKNINII